MIPYFVRAKRNPIAGSSLYYAQIGTTTPVGFEQIAEEISHTNTLTDADIAAVLKSLQRVILSHLRQGHAVRFGDLGSFRPTLSSEGKKTLKEVTASDIKRVRVKFRAGSWLTGNLAVTAPGISFTKVGEKA